MKFLSLNDLSWEQSDRSFNVKIVEVLKKVMCPESELYDQNCTCAVHKLELTLGRSHLLFYIPFFRKQWGLIKLLWLTKLVFLLLATVDKTELMPQSNRNGSLCVVVNNQLLQRSAFGEYNDRAESESVVQSWCRRLSLLHALLSGKIILRCALFVYAAFD